MYTNSKFKVRGGVTHSNLRTLSSRGSETYTGFFCNKVKFILTRSKVSGRVQYVVCGESDREEGETERRARTLSEMKRKQRKGSSCPGSGHVASSLGRVAASFMSAGSISRLLRCYNFKTWYQGFTTRWHHVAELLYGQFSRGHRHVA